MSQFDFGTINPDTKDGTTLAGDLGSWRDALNTLHRGATRPAYADGGMAWVKEVSGTLWELNIFDGTVDVVIATINPSTGVFSLPNDSVDNAAMQANAVNTGNIVNLAVTAEKLANLAVTAAKLANNAVLREKIDASSYASGTEIRQGQNGASIVSPSDMAIAQQSVGLPNTQFVTPNMHAGINFTCGQSQHFAVMNPTNQVAGRIGLLLFWNAGGGPHSVSWGSQVVSMSGSLPDVLEGGLLVPYYCEYVGRVWLP